MNVSAIGNLFTTAKQPERVEHKQVETAGSLALGGVETAGSMANNAGGTFCAMA